MSAAFTDELYLISLLYQCTDFLCLQTFVDTNSHLQHHLNTFVTPSPNPRSKNHGVCSFGYGMVSLSPPAPSQ